MIFPITETCGKTKWSHVFLSGLWRRRCAADHLRSRGPELSRSWRHQLPVFCSLGLSRNRARYVGATVAQRFIRGMGITRSTMPYLTCWRSYDR